MSKEALEQHDEEERIALGEHVSPAALEAGTVVQVQTPVPISNWRYFLHGSGISRLPAAQVQGRDQASQPAVELQDRAPQAGGQSDGGGGAAAAAGTGAVVPVETAVQQPDQPSRPRWQRLLRL
jgi:hypothetical protein